MKSESEVAQLCPTLSDPMDCSLPGSSAHGIFQARVLEWSAIAFSSTNDPIFQSINYFLNAKVENLHFAFSLKKAIGIFCEQVNIRDGFLSLSVFYSPLPSPLHTQQWYHIAEWMKGEVLSACCSLISSELNWEQIALKILLFHCFYFHQNLGLFLTTPHCGFPDYLLFSFLQV